RLDLRRVAKQSARLDAGQNDRSGQAVKCAVQQGAALFATTINRRYNICMKAEMDVVTNRKALQINLDAQKYGTFADVGAGQEVARRFFLVGGASGTIAITMSPYDMTFSDAIYGPADRYVTRVRLNPMLD